jgi:hypothetical protein
MWLIGAITALVFAFPATYWRNEAPWIMAIGVVVGVSFTLFVEISRSRKPQFLVTLSPGQKTWRFHRRILSLFIRRADPVPSMSAQLELIGLEAIAQKPAKRVIVIRDDQQRTMTLVELERFMARITSVIGEDLGRSSEYALRTAWERLKPLQDEYPQMELFFRDPMVIETLRKDISANAHMAIAKCGEQAARFFAEEFSKSQDVVHYRITPDPTPPTATPAPKRSRASRSTH